MFFFYIVVIIVMDPSQSLRGGKNKLKSAVFLAPTRHSIGLKGLKSLFNQMIH